MAIAMAMALPAMILLLLGSVCGVEEWAACIPKVIRVLFT